ncbi:hypothetical protein L1049_014885 [Liquidambar formosana]|uniref:Bet v I/Major latex protein domain-containing protein n=1 Tax=Liquidambar formosana TaxID=63359 RepID=A0AAP0S2X9_LIQFO
MVHRGHVLCAFAQGTASWSVLRHELMAIKTGVDLAGQSELKKIMGVTSFTQEFTTLVAPASLFEALIVDSHNLIPKLVTQGITSIEFIEGMEALVASSKPTSLRSMKHRIDVLDTENLVCKYTLIEADILGEKLESVVYKTKFEASSVGGCICKMSSEYHAKAGVELKEDEIKAGKDKAMGLYEVVEEYLLANPDVYA